MTLGTHAVVGAFAASLVPSHPAWGFAAGFLSHFAMDAIPHGHYKLRSKRYDPKGGVYEDMDVRSRAFAADIFHVGADALLGLAAALLLFGRASPVQALAGAVGGIVPDPLQFAYWKVRIAPLRILEKFHVWIHAKKRFDGAMGTSIAIEGGIIACAAIAGRLLLWIR